MRPQWRSQWRTEQRCLHRSECANGCNTQLLTAAAAAMPPASGLQLPAIKCKYALVSLRHNAKCKYALRLLSRATTQIASMPWNPCATMHNNCKYAFVSLRHNAKCKHALSLLSRATTQIASMPWNPCATMHNNCANAQ